MKNIILINDHAFVNGGQAKVAIETAIGLAKRRLNVTFFSACGPADASLTKNGVAVKCLEGFDILSDPNRLSAAIRGIWNSKAAFQLSKLLEKFNPNETIIHWHGFAKALSPSLGPVVTKSSIPHVFTLHEYFLACPNGGFYDYKKDQICKKKALGIGCLTTDCDVRHVAHKQWRVLRQLAMLGPAGLPRNLKNIIYISKKQREVLEPYLPRNARLFHLGNPVRKSRFERVDVNKNNVFLFVGRLNPEKGGILFAKATRQSSVRAIIVGDGAEKQKILELNPDVEVTGWLEQDDIESWYGKTRALVFPSLWYECQPLVPIEAIKRGIPVIAGKWTAASETIKENPASIIVDKPTVEGFSDAINKIKQSEISEYHANGIYEDYDVHFDKLIGTYNEIMTQDAE